jgi:hypothetical protein
MHVYQEALDVIHAYSGESTITPIAIVGMQELNRHIKERLCQSLITLVTERIDQ